MVQAEFTDEEIDIVKDTLRTYLSEIASDIYGTDNLTVEEATQRVQRTAKIKDLIGRMEKLAA
jgi:hypothetical protein